MEVHGLNKNQAHTGMDWINDLDKTGISAMSMEYCPSVGNPDLDEDVFRINVAGPNIAPFVVRVRNKVQNSLGRPLDLDENRTGDLAAIREAWLTYGTDLDMREPLELALIDIWRNGARCMSGQDALTLQRWMRNQGFANRQELRAWLRERP